MIYLWNNLIDGPSVSLSATSEDSEWPVENVQDQRIAKVWKTGASVALESVVIDFGSAVAIQSFVCFAHDLLETDSVIKIQGNASATWTAPSVDVTLTWASGAIVYNWSSAQTYRYWRFTFTKASAGVTRSIGRLFLGPLMTATGPIDKGYKTRKVDPSIVTESIPGQTYSNVKTTFREWTLSFDGFLQAEKVLYDSMTAAVGTHTAVFLQVHSSTSPLTEWIYAYLKKTPDFDYIATDGTNAIWKMDMEFREVV